MAIDSSRKNEEVIAALLGTPSIKEAANVVGLHENTVLRMMQKEEFVQAYRDARQALLTQTLERLQAINGQAVETLATIMGGASNPASARVSAARTVLEISLRIIETTDVLQRLAAIEGRLKDATD